MYLFLSNPVGKPLDPIQQVESEKTQSLSCSKIWMRGLTTLELKLGNAFGKTEHVLDEDSVVPLAWQVCGGGSVD